MINEVSVFRRNIILLISVFVLCIMISYILAGTNVAIVAGVVICIGLFICGFLSPRTALYMLIFSMLLSPEFGARDYTGKGFTIRFEDLLLVIMCFTWFAKSAVQKEVGLAVQTRLNHPILFYMLACFFATIFGIIDGYVDSPLTGALFVVKYFQYFVIYFLIVNNIQSKSQIRNLFTAVFITYIIVLIISLSQIPQGGRITAPFEGEEGEPNTLGGYLIMMFSLNIMLFFNVKKNSHRAFLAGTAFLNFLALLHTLSRASWLGFVVMYFSLLLFAKKRNILIFGLLAGLIIAPLTLPDIVVERIMYTFGIASEEVTARHQYLDEKMQQYKALSQEQKELVVKHTGIEPNLDTSTTMRLQSMQSVLKDIPKRPILGYGVTGYEFLDSQFPRVLIETGFIGIFAFLFLLWVTGRMLFSIWKEYCADPLYNTLSSGTLCAFIGLLVHCIGTNTFVIVRIMEPFWCLVGLNIAIPIVEKGREAFKIVSDKGTFQA